VSVPRHALGTRADGTRGASAMDALVVLAALGVVAALAYPAWSSFSFRRQVEQAIADVETASARARSSLEVLGRWPTSAPPGEAPPELAGLAFSRPAYALAWSTWEVVDSVAVPPDDVDPPAPGDAPPDSVGPPLAPVTSVIGSLAVHSAREELLAELLDHFGSDESFVLDTTWIRIFPERAGTAVQDVRGDRFRQFR
jgi:hypothetical protein